MESSPGASNFSMLDIAVFGAYCLLVISVALFVSFKNKKKERDSKDYFLAGNTLPWWAIGTSLIAANISAEQLIGMTGSGFAVGLGIASYEWMAAITLIVVAKFFLPIFLEKKIYTMPQFLEVRFDSRVRTALAIFWLFLYVFVNLTAIIYLGTIAIKGVLGLENTTENTLIIACVVAAFSTIYTLSGGLMAVAWTDPIQVFFLIAGGLVTSYLSLDYLSDHQGMIAGLHVLYDKTQGVFAQTGDQNFNKFDLILSKDNPYYKDLPGISVLIGGMWIANLSYWGCNQYITQRALAAKSLKEAQHGLAFAGYLKMLMPLIVVIPGMVAFVLNNQHDAVLIHSIDIPDETYPTLLNSFLFPGVKGLAFAALFAAIVGAISSKTNSIATIFTMDIYRNYINKNATEASLVRTGRIVTALSLILAIPVVPQLANFGQVFQYIQEYSGFVSPGVLVLFMFGLFWKRASANAAVWAAILTLPIGVGLKFGAPDVAFMDRMGITFLLLSLVMVVVSIMDNKQGSDPKAIDLGRRDDPDAILQGNTDLEHTAPKHSIFYTDPIFNVLAVGIMALLGVIYYYFW